MTFEVSIWGARGSISVSGSKKQKVGTNTPCVMARIDDRIIIFDAGSGIVSLGEKLLWQNVKHIDLFLSHPHYDHLFGLPFFTPLFVPEIDVNIHSAGVEGFDTAALIAKFMTAPFFPVSNEIFTQNTHYKTFDAGKSVSLSDAIEIETQEVNHPGRTCAFRLNFDGRSFCYAPDFEHDNANFDEALVAFMDKCDLAIVDATYTPEEYETARGFGHSNWQACGELCKRASVKSWRLFHHHHLHTDDEIESIEREAQSVFNNVLAAREGDVIKL